MTRPADQSIYLDLQGVNISLVAHSQAFEVPDLLLKLRLAMCALCLAARVLPECFRVARLRHGLDATHITHAELPACVAPRRLYHGRGKH